MNYGKVLTVALLGGMMLAGCTKKDEPTPPSKDANGNPLPGAVKDAQGMEKGGMKTPAATQESAVKESMSNMGNSLKDAGANLKDAAGHQADAAKNGLNNLMGTTQPSR